MGVISPDRMEAGLISGPGVPPPPRNPRPCASKAMLIALTFLSAVSQVKHLSSTLSQSHARQNTEPHPSPMEPVQGPALYLELHIDSSTSDGLNSFRVKFKDKPPACGKGQSFQTPRSAELGIKESTSSQWAYAAVGSLAAVVTGLGGNAFIAMQAPFSFLATTLGGTGAMAFSVAACENAKGRKQDFKAALRAFQDERGQHQLDAQGQCVPLRKKFP